MKSVRFDRLHSLACQRSQGAVLINLSRFDTGRRVLTRTKIVALHSSGVTYPGNRYRNSNPNPSISADVEIIGWIRLTTASTCQICDRNRDFSSPNFDFVLHFVMAPAKLWDMSPGNATSESSDDELAAIVAACSRNGSASEESRLAFTLLYRRYARLLRSFLASRVTPSELDDVEQTIWQRIWVHLPQQFSGGNFRAWMYQISRNFLIDQTRRKRSTPFPEGFDVEDVHVAPPDMTLMEHERIGALEACLKRLPEQMNNLVRARLSGDDYDAICERMDLPVPRAQKLFFQAKEALVSCLKERDL